MSKEIPAMAAKPGIDPARVLEEQLESASPDPQRVPAPGPRHPRRHDRRAIPKLRQGCYLPDWLLERRRRAEAALTSAVATSYLLGVSTRRMEKLVEARRPISTPRWRRSGPGGGPYTFMAADALVLKVREGGHVVNVDALVATG
jgi:transposase-like protein